MHFIVTVVTPLLRASRNSLGYDACMAERWVKVAAAPDESIALLMDGVLKDAGIPSLIQRAFGFDAPDFLAAGPRDVLVPGSLAEEARQVLEDTTGLGSYAP